MLESKIVAHIVFKNLKICTSKVQPFFFNVWLIAIKMAISVVFLAKCFDIILEVKKE